MGRRERKRMQLFDVIRWVVNTVIFQQNCMPNIARSCCSVRRSLCAVPEKFTFRQLHPIQPKLAFLLPPAKEAFFLDVLCWREPRGGLD
jgi:hypothetical protein|eukprot:COSAG06_NODE_3727_length_4971_cov_2.507389_9_plen_89_part_00